MQAQDKAKKIKRIILNKNEKCSFLFNNENIISEVLY